MRALGADRGGYALTFWAVFIGLVVLPLAALVLDLGRGYLAASELQQAADAAAEAAAGEFDAQVYRERGVLVPNARAWAVAQAYAALNTPRLARWGVRAAVTGLELDGPGNRARVALAADLAPLFPIGLPRLRISQEGRAALRALVR